MTVEWWAWAAVVAFILGMLMVDLLVFHRHAHAVTTGEAATWSALRWDRDDRHDRHEHDRGYEEKTGRRSDPSSVRCSSSAGTEAPIRRGEWRSDQGSEEDPD